MDAGAVVAAAGSGSRLGAGTPKQFLSLGGVPVLVRTLQALSSSPLLGVIVPVVPTAFLGRVRRLLERWDIPRCAPPVAGGARRQDSVRAGLEALPPTGLVLVHDAARPFVTPHMVERCLGAASFTGAALCAIQPAETVKLSADGRFVGRTIDRSGVWLAQTPQAFRRQTLAEAYLAADPAREYTDEAALVEAAGHDVALVAGDPSNIKITTPGDLRLARYLLRATARMGGPVA